FGPEVFRFAPDGSLDLSFGSSGTGDGKFGEPPGVAADGNGNIFVTDRVNNRVQVFDPSGNFLAEFGEPGTNSGQFEQMGGIRVAPDGYVYVVATNRLHIFEPVPSRVLFDEAHSGFVSIEDNYRELADRLRARGYVVERLTTAPVTAQRLSEYDVYVIGTPWGNFTQSELDDIEEFVQSGGGLFLTGLGWSWVNPGEGRTLDNYPPNVVGARYGIRFLDDAICDPANPHEGNFCTPVFRPDIGHQVLDGLGSLGGPIYAAPITTTLPIAFPLLTGGVESYSNLGRYSEGMYPPVAVVSLYGRGRVLALGHEGYLGTTDYDADGTPNLFDHDNLQFGLNVFDWLAKRCPQGIASMENYYDDGSDETGFVTWRGGVGAVRFIAPIGARVEALRFRVSGQMKPVSVHVLDRNWLPLYTRTVTPSPGWFEVDVSQANVSTDGEFYVAWQWIDDSPQGPWLGIDKTGPHHNQSYLGNLDPANPPQVVSGEDYMIRAVVSCSP
ncbi:MAG: NHL repeat-containing protein, partial [Anaerolineae bacterium]|nr:NHL repeat-containing protein [Anaerolineae bacterium]